MTWNNGRTLGIEPETLRLHDILCHYPDSTALQVHFFGFGENNLKQPIPPHLVKLSVEKSLIFPVRNGVVWSFADLKTVAVI